MGHQLDFLCKFSDPLHAAAMEATVSKLDEVCTMVSPGLLVVVDAYR